MQARDPTRPSAQVPGTERSRQERRQARLLDALGPDQENAHLPAELAQRLAAGAAGRQRVVAVRGDRDHLEAFRALADGLADRDALGAEGQAVAGVLDVAARV